MWRKEDGWIGHNRLEEAGTAGGVAIAASRPDESRHPKKKKSADQQTDKADKADKADRQIDQTDQQTDRQTRQADRQTRKTRQTKAHASAPVETAAGAAGAVAVENADEEGDQHGNGVAAVFVHHLTWVIHRNAAIF